MGAEYLSYVNSIATFAPTFYGYIISVLARVQMVQNSPVYLLPVIKHGNTGHKILLLELMYIALR